MSVQRQDVALPLPAIIASVSRPLAHANSYSPFPAKDLSSDAAAGLALDFATPVERTNPLRAVQQRQSAAARRAHARAAVQSLSRGSSLLCEALLPAAKAHKTRPRLLGRNKQIAARGWYAPHAL